MEVLPASLCRASHSGPGSVSLTRNVPLISKKQDQALPVCCHWHQEQYEAMDGHYVAHAIKLSNLRVAAGKIYLGV